jgi:Transglutaminase-like superfamily
MTIGDQETADELLRSRLVRVAEGYSSIAPSPVPSARSDILDITAGPLALSDLWSLTQAYAAVSRSYYGRSFGDILEVARRHKPLAPNADIEALCRSAAVFARCLPLVPAQGECLFRSFMLLAFLRSKGFDATWVFGVRTWPFQAHCWLQVGEVVVDDAVDRISPFTPILGI